MVQMKVTDQEVICFLFSSGLFGESGFHENILRQHQSCPLYLIDCCVLFKRGPTKVHTRASAVLLHARRRDLFVF